MPQQYSTATYHPSMQYASTASLGRPTLTPSYTAMGPDLDLNIETAASEQPEEELDILAASSDRCQRTIGIVNDYTSRGHLVKAGECLLEMSQWLSENLDALSEATLELPQF